MFTNTPDNSDFESHPNVLRVTHRDPGISLVVDAPYDDFIDFLKSSGVIEYKTGLYRRSRNLDVMFRHPDIAGPATLYPAERTERDYGLEDFFVTGDEGPQEAEADEPDLVGITVSPFGGRERLAERTGRNYFKEDCDRIWWLVYAATHSTDPPALPAP